MTHIQRFSLASIVALTAVFAYMSFTLVASANTGITLPVLQVYSISSNTIHIDWDQKSMQQKWEDCRTWDGMKGNWDWNRSSFNNHDWNWWNDKCKDWSSWQHDNQNTNHENWWDECDTWNNEWNRREEGRHGDNDSWNNNKDWNHDDEWSKDNDWKKHADADDNRNWKEDHH